MPRSVPKETTKDSKSTHNTNNANHGHNTNRTNDLLFEIGTEELPPKSLKSLQDDLIDNISALLKKAELSFGEIHGFVTPRRITVKISDLAAKQPEKTVVKKGPAKTAAVDEKGNPSKALLGFAASCGVTVEKLKLEETEKGAWYSFEEKQEGKTVAALLPNLLKESIDALPLPKRMRWGEGTGPFIRPVHWLVLLYGSESIPMQLFDIHSSNKTRGHRFMHPGSLSLSKPADYEEILFNSGKVRADFEKRKTFILQEIKSQAKKHHATIEVEEALLNEVTGLTEWPVILIGQFAAEFLKIPKEILICTMKTHQKCFPLQKDADELMAKFFIISNIESKDPAQVIRGNEAVIHARLADAAFHYEVDKQTPLEARREGLKNVVFQQGLGTLWDKSLRLNKLTSRMLSLLLVIPKATESNKNQSEKNKNEILKQIKEDLTDKKGLSHRLERAALLCKADLLTQMVGEFPELQGIMGRYYAIQDGECQETAVAIEEHYHPRFANDSLPNSIEGALLAIADRIDSLVGLFGIGKRATGDKDPFGLRRQALGILRIIIEKEIKELDLDYLFSVAEEFYSQSFTESPKNALIAFCFERLRAWYVETGIAAKVFEAVVARQPTKPLDFHYRILAVTEFVKLPEAESLSAANKRVQNILIKSEIPIPPDAEFEANLLVEPAEIALAKAIKEHERQIGPLIERWQYTDALKILASLKEPIDAFFDSVMVMVEDNKLRNNRLKLLNHLRALFLKIADISLL